MEKNYRIQIPMSATCIHLYSRLAVYIHAAAFNRSRTLSLYIRLKLLLFCKKSNLFTTVYSINEFPFMKRACF